MIRIWISFVVALLVAAPASTQPYVFATNATIVWEAPTDGAPPEGYYVYVSRNGGDFVKENTVQETQAPIEANLGDTLRIEVSGYIGDHEGPRSLTSDPWTFTFIGIPGQVTIFGVEEISPGVYAPTQ